MFTLIYGSFTDDVFAVCRDCECIDSCARYHNIYTFTDKQNGFRCAFFRDAPIQLKIERGIAMERKIEVYSPKHVHHFHVVKKANSHKTIPHRNLF